MIKHKCSEPLISFLIPVYNAETTVIECIQSIISQDFHNYEIIIVDDGSTDRSVNTLESYIEEYNKKQNIIWGGGYH